MSDPKVTSESDFVAEVQFILCQYADDDLPIGEIVTKLRLVFAHDPQRDTVPPIVQPTARSNTQPQTLQGRVEEYINKLGTMHLT